MPRNNFSRHNFQLILQFLHFVDKSHCNSNGPDHDGLYKVRPVVQYPVSKLKSVNISEEHISIDEEVLLWKGELLLKQYIALKRPRFGIRIFSLCETTGYLWNSYVYLDKVPNVVVTDMEMLWRLGESGTVIRRLMEGLLGKGYKLHVYNWYTSENLFFLSFMRMR